MWRQLLSALDQIEEHVLFYNSNLQIVWVNQAVCRWASKEPEALWGQYCYEAFHDRPVPCPGCPVLKVLESKRAHQDERMTKDGRIWVLKVYPVERLTGDGPGAMEISVDVTQQRTKEARYRSIMAQVLDGVCVVRMSDRKVEEGNQALERVLGYEESELRRLTFYDLVDADPQEVDAWLNHAMETQEGRVFELGFRAKSGELVDMEVSVNPIRVSNESFVCIVCRDIRPRKRWEREKLRAQKLESLGMLAGGIAHDFNNALAAILGNLSLAKLDASPGTRLYDRLEGAEKACFRAQSITRQLLTFSKGGDPIKSIVHPKDLLKRVVSSGLPKSGAVVEMDVSDDLWRVEVDEALISQAIHQILQNAEDAVDGRGRISLQARNRWIQESMERLTPGPYVEIRIRDNGEGLPEEVLDKVFDPYFGGPTSGLGLSMTYSVLKRHGGTISIHSELGRGTEVILYIPATSPDQAEEEHETTVLPHAWRAGGRILVMDDEAMVRETLGEMLRLAGFEVVLTEDGREAVSKFQKQMDSGRPIDVVILDLTVPGGMGGVETLKELKRLDPGVRAIVSSGYSNDPVMARYRDYGFQGVVCKPYRMDDMMAELRRVMEEETRSVRADEDQPFTDSESSDPSNAR